MNKINNLNTLWGSTIYDTRIDLLTHDINLFIKLEETDSIKFYNIVFSGVYHFEIVKKKILTWYYAELTQIDCKYNSLYEIDLILWDENNRIKIKCKDFNVTLTHEDKESE